MEEFTKYRQCDNKEDHEPHTHMAAIGPGIRGVARYRCGGVKHLQETQYLVPPETMQCPIQADHPAHDWTLRADAFDFSRTHHCPGRYENDGTDIKFEIAGQVVKKYDDPASGD